jgi:hypothetical protein
MNVDTEPGSSISIGNHNSVLSEAIFGGPSIGKSRDILGRPTTTLWFLELYKKESRTKSGSLEFAKSLRYRGERSELRYVSGGDSGQGATR